MNDTKSDAYRKEKETPLKFDMIELSKSPWKWGVVLAKMRGLIEVLL